MADSWRADAKISISGGTGNSQRSGGRFEFRPVQTGEIALELWEIPRLTRLNVVPLLFKQAQCRATQPVLPDTAGPITQPFHRLERIFRMIKRDPMVSEFPVEFIRVIQLKISRPGECPAEAL